MLKAEIAKDLGLSENVKVIAGAGDNAAAAVGTGTVGDGRCNISIGTSGRSLSPAGSLEWMSIMRCIPLRMRMEIIT